MGWVLLEIIIPLILAVLVGLLLGWMLWRWRRTKVTYSEWETETTTDVDTSRQVGGGAVASGTGATALGLATMVDADANVNGVDVNGVDVGRSDELEGELASSRLRVSDLESELSSSVARRADMEARLAASDARVVDFEDELRINADRASELGRANAAKDAEIERLTVELATARSRSIELETQAAERTEQLEALSIDLRAARSNAPGTEVAGIAAQGFASGYRPAGTHPGGTRASGSGGDDDRGGEDIHVVPTSIQGVATPGSYGYAFADGADPAPFGDGSLGRLSDRSIVPDGYPIKGNADSMLYHRPDSRNYAATIAEVWFDTTDHAESAGFSLAPTHPLDESPDGLELARGALYQPYGEGSHGQLAQKGSAPAGFTIKGNADSMLYHRPDSRSYKQTIAEVWFDTADRAEAAGFRLAVGSHPRSS